MNAIRDIVEQFMPLAHDEARGSRAARRLFSDIEVLSAAMLGLLDAARKFSPDKQGEDGFVAYARKVIRSRIKTLWQQRNVQPWVVTSTVSPDFLEHCRAADDAHEEARSEVREALGLLSPRHALLLSRHYGLDEAPMTVAQLAAADGISVRRVQNRLKNAHLKMRDVLLAGRD